jgi:ankyrin repeat protein
MDPLNIRALLEEMDFARIDEFLGGEVNRKWWFEDALAPLICIAARCGKLEVVRWLLETKGANIYAKTEWGASALSWALIHDHFVIAEYLMDRGLSVHEKENGCPLLISVALFDSVHAVEFLLKYGADVNATDNLGHTALFYAQGKNKRATVSLLLKAGAMQAID